MYSRKNWKQRAKYLRLASMRVSHGLRSGLFSSRFSGYGIEFDSVREYEFGDDVRSIDWNLTARSQRVYVKQHREERDLSIFVIIDVSPSMRLHYEQISPLDKAMETAAILLFAGNQSDCPVGAVAFHGRTSTAMEPKTGENYVLSVLQNLDKFIAREAEPGSVLRSAITGAIKNVRNRALVIIISDFNVTNYERELGLLARKHDTIAIRIVSAIDEQLPEIGSIHFADTESDYSCIIVTNSNELQQLRKKQFNEQLNHWENVCVRYGVLPLRLGLGDDTVRVLQGFFMSAKSKSDFLNKLKLSRTLV